MKVPDPAEQKKNQIKFIEALYSIVIEDRAPDGITTGDLEDVIGKRAGLNQADAVRASDQLASDGLIRYAGVVGGPHCSLTKEGRDFIEQHLFDKSSRGRARVVKAKVFDLGKAGAGKLVSDLSKLVIGGLATAGAIYFRPLKDAFLKWIGWVP